MSRPDWTVRIASGGRLPAFVMLTREDVSAIVQDCNPTALAVFAVLGTYASREGTGAFPMQRRVAADLGCSRRTVKRAVQDLRRAGFLTAVWEGTARGKRRVYELHFPSPLPPPRR